jgi:pyrimidine deaminase RibD-like protein
MFSVFCVVVGSDRVVGRAHSEVAGFVHQVEYRSLNLQD